MQRIVLFREGIPESAMNGTKIEVPNKFIRQAIITHNDRFITHDGPGIAHLAPTVTHFHTITIGASMPKCKENDFMSKLGRDQLSSLDNRQEEQ